MADPLSIASGIIAVTTAALQSSKALYETIESFRNYPTRLANLKNQVKALSQVLGSLEKLINTNQADLSSLEFPLKQCSIACDGFKAVLDNFQGAQKKGLAKYADWIKLTYMGGDIVSFIEMLAGYKATINIAIADANLRTSTVTLGVLNAYKAELDATASHLRLHLEEINSRLETFAPRTGGDDTDDPDLPSTDVSRLDDERASTEKCLQICSQYLDNINSLQLRLVSKSSREHAHDVISPPDLTMANALTLSCFKSCTEQLYDTLKRLQAHQDQLENKVDSSDTQYSPGQVDQGQVQRLTSELDSTQQLLSFCTKAASRASSHRVHRLENISVGNDARQMCISTVGDLFEVKGATAGDGSLQIFGSIGPVLHESFRGIFEGRSRPLSSPADKTLHSTGTPEHDAVGESTAAAISNSQMRSK